LQGDYSKAAEIWADFVIPRPWRGAMALNSNLSTFATRRSLVDGLANWRDRRHWQDFHRVYARLIYGFARRAGLTDAEANDALQETLLTVARRAEGFKYDPVRGSFKGWILQIARWRVADQYRKRLPVEGHLSNGSDGGSARTATIARAMDPAGPELERKWSSEWHADLLEKALKRVKGKVSARQYQIFDCYVIKEWPATRVQRDLGVNLAQVYLAKHRVAGLLKKEVEGLLGDGELNRRKQR
jgi:RNA polymerase sigma factor (sigma-70 family)